MTKPLITAAFTAYEAEDTIEQAVDSARRQTWPAIEILVVDDRSTDATPEILARTAARDSRIKVLRNDANKGIAASRNRLIAEAKGEFIAFFDDDDVSSPRRIEAQHGRIAAYEADHGRDLLVICHASRTQRFPGGRTRVEPTMGARTPGLAPHGLAVAHRILMGTPLRDGYGACATCSQMARVSTYRTAGGFDVRLRRSSDTDFNVRLAKMGGHFAGVSEPLVEQTMTIAEKNLAEEFRNARVLLDLHRDVLDQAGQYEFCHRWIDAKQAWLEGRKIAAATKVSGLLAFHPGLTVRRAALAIRSLASHGALSRLHAGERRTQRA